MGYTIGIIGQLNNEILNSQAICCESEPSELCTIFSYEEDNDPWILNDMEYMNDGLNFIQNKQILRKGYSLTKAKEIVKGMISKYEKIANEYDDYQDLNAAKDLYSILEKEPINKAEIVFFIEVRF